MAVTEGRIKLKDPLSIEVRIFRSGQTDRDDDRRTLFVILSFIFWPLHWQSFFGLHFFIYHSISLSFYYDCYNCYMFNLINLQINNLLRHNKKTWTTTFQLDFLLMFQYDDFIYSYIRNLFIVVIWGINNVGSQLITSKRDILITFHLSSFYIASLNILKCSY